jgi:hypothetical protein
MAIDLFLFYFIFLGVVRACGGFFFFFFFFLRKTGDDPPRDRTAELRALGFPTRHLGPVQMTTDTALGVAKRVVVDRGSSLPSLPPPSHTTRLTVLARNSSARGHPICRTFAFSHDSVERTNSGGALGAPPLLVADDANANFWRLYYLQDYPTIRFNARESVEMPFRASL